MTARKSALILVDLQNDFLPGGALAVQEGDKVLPIANRLLRLPFDLKVASKDWHPKNHGSFAANHGKQPGEKIQLQGIPQILWPSHCIQGTSGAEFASDWESALVDHVVYKGTDPTIDSYSAFFDNQHLRSTGLAEYLKERSISDLYVAGLATDYCVKFSALDARKLGFNVYVIPEGCRAVNLDPADEPRAYAEMRAAGVQIVSLEDVAQQLKGIPM